MFWEELNNLQKVFDRFRVTHLKVNCKKCQLFQKELQCLTHAMSPEGMTTDPEKLKSVWEWPFQKDRHE
jgi:hypothetical protein